MYFVEWCLLEVFSKFFFCILLCFYLIFTSLYCLLFLLLITNYVYVLICLNWRIQIEGNPSNVRGGSWNFENWKFEMPKIPNERSPQAKFACLFHQSFPVKSQCRLCRMSFVYFFSESLVPIPFRFEQKLFVNCERSKHRPLRLLLARFHQIW